MLNILRRRRSRDLPDYVADRGCPYRSVVTALLIEGGLVAAALLPLVLLSCCDPKASSERPAVFPSRATVTADDLDGHTWESQTAATPADDESPRPWLASGARRLL
jgi:hypothetical protein